MESMGTEKACCAVLGVARGKQIYEAIVLAQGGGSVGTGPAE
jgi:hypothetical protein